MRMLVTLEFADAGTKSGTHRVLMMGRDTVLHALLPVHPKFGHVSVSQSRDTGCG
jgi:hypothetical protein